MDFLCHKSSFDSLIGVKILPNEHEKVLFARAEKYIRKITWIPGLRMVAVVNSLSMYATHEDSDIDLFVVTANHRIWWVRSTITLIFSWYGIWRHGEDIAGNFCLSFFIEESAMDLSSVAIEDDIYLYYWIYYMRPIFAVGDTWERFLEANNSIKQEKKISPLFTTPLRVTLGDIFGDFFDTLIRPLGEWKARRSHEKKGKPEGVIIRSDMLKFHDDDKRKEVRDTLLERIV